MISRRNGLLGPLIVLLSMGAIIAPTMHLVAAAGQLYVSPSSNPAQLVGSTFTIQVKVANMDPFNGWEVQVAYDPSVINATSLDTSGNILVTNTTGGISFQTRNCVNGKGQGCCLINSCTPLDGVGEADSAFADTQMASGNGLLFTVTFQVVSNGPFSPITIHNDVLSNGGRNGVVHTTTSGTYGASTSLSVSKFFTDGNFTALPLDNKSNPMVTVILANGVKSTNPGEVKGWVSVTNTGQTKMVSLSITDNLPVDWQISPPWPPSQGAIHMYYANTSSLATNPDITVPSTISTTAGNPQSVSLSIPDLTKTAIGHALLPGQTILLSVKLSYALEGTTQSFASFPRVYSDSASASATSDTGVQTSGSGTASFTAYARALGDVNGDGNVDLTDVSAAVAAFGSTPGSVNWNPNADFANTGTVGITDLATVFYYYGTTD